MLKKYMICAFFGDVIMTQSFFPAKPVTRLEKLEEQLELARIRLEQNAKTADNDTARVRILDQIRSIQHKIAQETKRPRPHGEQLKFDNTYHHDANDPDQDEGNAFSGMVV